ncbi:ThiF family adenylyltransferase [Methylotenera mobilis]|uniref:UBA/THIF-type NAD/FAD binding protein n=1 Tax=Methylotenera mobilis (strain JLW8 / ATCC BAA-1282 / DSM 17540) TaxID=583345 RepID=C6WWR6_METML|nr:ThiF family adenylyltransferase [Methylotenera mobilis]ACT48365.1 UBA/THIF-type NAD/FAD binding protein [Methylotenera mobilis JLW8]
MSHQLIAHSPDLQKLRNQGLDLDIQHGYLLIKDVPYVNASREVKLGTLVSRLELNGDITNRPSDHVAYWVGEHPCHSTGAVIATIQNPSAPQDLGNGLKVDFTFSAKAEYRDYHHKMTTYIGRITGEAQVIDAAATAETYPVIPTEENESVFKYQDTASSRVNIGNFNEKLAGQRIGIVGLGGTGSYVLDLVAKTCVKEIHLFDGDVFSQHNAFRTPGAASIDELKIKPSKVMYLESVYAKMRHGLVIHETYIDSSTSNQLNGLDFVFLCLDRGASKKAIVATLIQLGIPFIEVGMGVVRSNDSLSGIIRVVTGTKEVHDKVLNKINFSEGDAPEDEYSTNIQIAELNALNACLAVIRWKKVFGFFRDSSDAHFISYSIAANEMVNEDE